MEGQQCTCLRTLRGERRYERPRITGLTGLTEAQRAAVLALGAVEQQAQLGGARPGQLLEATVVPSTLTKLAWWRTMVPTCLTV